MHDGLVLVLSCIIVGMCGLSKVGPVQDSPISGLKVLSSRHSSRLELNGAAVTLLKLVVSHRVHFFSAAL